MANGKRERIAAVHLEANVGRVAVCAEALALGLAVAAGDGTIETIVAVDADGEVVAPCGMCREMISDYAPAARILPSLDSKVSAISIVSLLPLRSSSDYLTWNGCPSKTVIPETTVSGMLSSQRIDSRAKLKTPRGRAREKRETRKKLSYPSPGSRYDAYTVQ